MPLFSRLLRHAGKRWAYSRGALSIIIIKKNQHFQNQPHDTKIAYTINKINIFEMNHTIQRWLAGQASNEEKRLWQTRLRLSHLSRLTCSKFILNGSPSGNLDNYSSCGIEQESYTRKCFRNLFKLNQI